jgi:hypothetical protein
MLMKVIKGLINNTRKYQLCIILVVGFILSLYSLYEVFILHENCQQSSLVGRCKRGHWFPVFYVMFVILVYCGKNKNNK